MDIFIISFAALLTAILTFFSGFGLGTILLPVFSIFFPVESAVALTGVVHFANNLFKIALIGKRADKPVIKKFGIPAVIASFFGALILLKLSDMPSLFSYAVRGKEFEITPVKLIISILLIFFSMKEILPASGKNLSGKTNLLAGGLLSGFFGGLAGIQGALRSAFLIRSGLSKEEYIATGVVIASMVDLTRLSVYVTHFTSAGLGQNTFVVVSAVLSAIAGAFIGSRLLKKITFRFVQVLVAVMLIIVSVALGAGLI